MGSSVVMTEHVGVQVWTVFLAITGGRIMPLGHVGLKGRAFGANWGVCRGVVQCPIRWSNCVLVGRMAPEPGGEGLLMNWPGRSHCSGFRLTNEV